MVWREVGKFFLNLALLLIGALVVQPVARYEASWALLGGGALAALYFFVLGLYCLKKGEEHDGN